MMIGKVRSGGEGKIGDGRVLLSLIVIAVLLQWPNLLRETDKYLIHLEDVVEWGGHPIVDLATDRRR